MIETYLGIGVIFAIVDLLVTHSKGFRSYLKDEKIEWSQTSLLLGSLLQIAIWPVSVLLMIQALFKNE